MFKTKLTNYNITTSKSLKPNNVPINVMVVVIIHSQVLEWQVLRDQEPIKAKETNDWEKNKKMWDSFVETIMQKMMCKNL